MREREREARTSKPVYNGIITDVDYNNRDFEKEILMKDIKTKFVCRLCVSSSVSVR